MLFATSLALWTNCRLATGFDVLEEARRQALHRAEVCLATIVAAERTLGNAEVWEKKKHLKSLMTDVTFEDDFLSKHTHTNRQKKSLEYSEYIFEILKNTGKVLVLWCDMMSTEFS